MSTAALALALISISAGWFVLGWVAGVYSLNKAVEQGRYPRRKDNDR